MSTFVIMCKTPKKPKKIILAGTDVLRYNVSVYNNESRKERVKAFVLALFCLCKDAHNSSTPHGDKRQKERNIMKKEELEIKFKSGEEMLQMLKKGIDLYNPKTGVYVFLYSHKGAIAYYNGIPKKDALRYASEQAEGTCWEEIIGNSGFICDVPSETGHYRMSNIDLCNEQYEGLWINTSNLLQWYGPYMVAYNIEWETDGEDVDLPKEIQIPADQISIGDGYESVSNYLSDVTGWLNSWFHVGLKLRGEIMELVINSYEDNIRFAFEKGNLLSGGYVLSLTALFPTMEIVKAHTRLRMVRSRNLTKTNLPFEKHQIRCF